MIGLLGGTFDPVHFGHLRPALEVRQQLGLDEVRFIPCRVPPHRDAPAASADLRLRMLQAALAGTPGFTADERELRREGPSYMVDTLRSLRAELGAMPLDLILGADAFAGIDTWHQWREIPELCHLVVMQRPGWDVPVAGEAGALVRGRLAREPQALRAQPAGLVYFCAVTALDISATRIRELLSQGLSPRYLLPDAVLEIIEAERIY